VNARRTPVGIPYPDPDTCPSCHVSKTLVERERDGGISLDYDLIVMLKPLNP
jgi:hypothetical protein